MEQKQAVKCYLSKQDREDLKKLAKKFGASQSELLRVSLQFLIFVRANVTEMVLKDEQGIQSTREDPSGVLDKTLSTR